MESKSKTLFSITSFYDNLPLIVSFSFLSFAISQTIFSSISYFNWFSVLISILVGLASGIWLSVLLNKRHDVDERLKEKRIVIFIICLYIGAWIFFSAYFVQQNVFTYRDPALYTTASVYIANDKDNDTPDYLSTSAYVDTQGRSGLLLDGKTDGNIEFHGSGLLPGLGAVAHRYAGEYSLFRINLFIAAIALLAVFSFAVKYMRPIYALITIILVSLSLPFIYYSRDLYSEIIAIVFIFTALALILNGYKIPRPKTYWLITGAILGFSFLARIDMILFSAPVVAGLFLLFAKSTNSKSKHAPYYVAYGYILSVSISLALMLHSSYQYLQTHKNQISAELVLALILLFLAAFVAKSEIIARLFKTTKRTRLALTGTAALAAVFGFLIARPLWYPLKDYIISFRDIAGREVVLINPEDGVGALYNNGESIALWVSSYLGIPIAAISLLGLLYLVYYAVKKNSFKLYLISLAAIPTTVLYLIRPSITPDHIWAVRRLLPITIIFAIIIFVYVVYKLSLYIRLSTVRLPVFLLVITVSTMPMVAIAKPTYLARLNQGGLQQIKAVCQSLPENSTLIWGGSMAYEAVYAVNAYCDNVDAVGLNNYGKEALVDVYRKATSAGRTLFIGYAAPQNLIDGIDSDNLSWINTITNKDLKMKLYGVPSAFSINERPIVIGKIDADGLVSSL